MNMPIIVLWEWFQRWREKRKLARLEQLVKKGRITYSSFLGGYYRLCNKK